MESIELQAETPKWTFIFIAVAVVCFVIQQFTDLWIYFAFFPALAVNMPWMFVTSIFLHSGVEHLLFNMLALFFMGMSLERMIGHKAFAMLFIASGVVGNVGYMLTASDPMTPAIGASGAIYGVIGTLATLAPLMLIFIYGIIPLPMVVAAVLWGLLDYIGLFDTSGIAHGAHLGGLFLGVAFGLYLRWRVSDARRQSHFLRR
ncbi:MAG: rhomboid family intramembrane serine protease [Thaumarchaeota archaeon]|nr:rhomboid family intramembrane serine protease [Nitrososphaerota archaeon]MCL5317178.1 rhomboid family intramembrane serine protease [Nitrososphaerota archaeon]